MPTFFVTIRELLSLLEAHEGINLRATAASAGSAQNYCGREKVEDDGGSSDLVRGKWFDLSDGRKGGNRATSEGPMSGLRRASRDWARGVTLGARCARGALRLGTTKTS